MDEEPKTSSRNRPHMPGSSTLIVAASGLAVLAIVALPMIKQREQPTTVANDARAAYLALMEQMEPQDQEAGAPAAADSSTGALSASGRLERDLFAPAARRAAPVASIEGESSTRPAASATPVRRRPPALNGIFIDGEQARAVIGDQVVSVGEWVKDFQVIEIQAGWVLLKRGEQVEKLELGGGR